MLMQKLTSKDIIPDLFEIHGGTIYYEANRSVITWYNN